jgi:hypothetical protein
MADLLDEDALEDARKPAFQAQVAALGRLLSSHQSGQPSLVQLFGWPAVQSAVHSAGQLSQLAPLGQLAPPGGPGQAQPGPQLPQLAPPFFQELSPLKAMQQVGAQHRVLCTG